MPAYMQHIINPVRTLALVLLISTPVLSASSILSETAQVRIEGDSPTSRLTIHVENANLEDVLAQLALKFGFEFEVDNKINSEPHWSATLAASNLETLLHRLLRNRNHFIIRSDGASGPIRRILLIETRAGSNLAQSPVRTKANASTRRRKAVKNSARPKNKQIKTRNKKTP